MESRVAPARNLRARILPLAATAALLIVGAITAVNSVVLSRLADRTQTDPYDTQFNALSARVAALEQQLDGIARQPAGVRQADFERDRQALEARLAQAEQALADVAPVDAVQALRARVDGVEARLARPKPEPRTAAPPRRVAVAEKPTPPVPTFRVTGVQLRGSEQLLSVLPYGATTLGQVRLLREGDHEGAWQLQSIEADTAVFRVAGQTQRLPVR